MSPLHDDIEHLLRVHHEGTPFFDALDEYLAMDSVFYDLYRLAVRLYPTSPFVASGRFGYKFDKWLRSEVGESAYLFPGDLRHHPERAVGNPYLGGRRWIFIDDSMYKGRTFVAIRRAVENSGGSVLPPIVAYDGSINLFPHSLYSYFHEHPERMGK